MGNIREVAKLAGVSVTTASRVFNGHPYVSDEKVQAVMEAAEKLNYTKNINAVHLSKGRTNSVGIVLPFLHLPYYGEWLHGLAEEAIKEGINLQVFQTDYQKKAEIDALQSLKSRQVDGLIIVSRINEIDVISAFKEDGPIVLCEKIEHGFSSVYIDHYQAFQTGLETLWEKGHQSIGLCIHRKTGTNSIERMQAYRDFLKKYQLELNEDWIFTGCYTINDGIRVMNEWAKQMKRPTALLATSDQVAAGIVSEAKKAGIDIPGDLAVMSCDNHPISELLDITTIHIPVKEMGRRAFKLFIHSMNGEDNDQEKLETKIFMRSTI
ncbi:LacI family DNA-binding transcriptional regulator [Falsibacillus pallidus]|uniref:LacI family DNA-binding transcriptional regulator n=1 Tax=Falsibacillus pallidus TaxID=493781 RepID=UPI003D9998CC